MGTIKNMLFGGYDAQYNISNRLPLPVDILADTAFVNDISGESVALYYWNSNVLTADAGQAAGTVVIAKFKYTGILDALGGMIGNEGDTSISWTTGTVLTSEQRCDYSAIENPKNATLEQIATQLTANYSNGEYCVDYRNGILYGLKATIGTGDTAAYKVLSQTTGGGTSITASQDLEKIVNVTISAKNAAFDEPPLGMGGEYELLGSLSTDAGTAGDKTPLKTSAKGVIYTNLINIAGTKEAVLLEGATHGSGDAGVMSLVVRNDTLADLSGGDGKYSGIQVNAKGSVYADLSSVLGSDMSATNPVIAELTDGSAVISTSNPLTVNLSDGTNAMVMNAAFAEEFTEANNSLNASAMIYGFDSEATATHKMRAVQVAVDNAGISATPNVLIGGGIYKSALDTYGDNDAVPFHFDVNGRLMTTSELIDYADDSNFTVASDKVIALGGYYSAAGDNVDDTDIGVLAMTINRHLMVRSDSYDTSTTADKSYEIAPLNTKHTEETIATATSQGDGTTYYYWDMDGYRYFSLQIENTDGAAGDNTYTLEATNQDDGTAAASCTYQDVTNQWTGAANYTASAFPEVDTPTAAKYVRIKVVRANDGANTDGAWTLYLKKMF